MCCLLKKAAYNVVKNFTKDGFYFYLKVRKSRNDFFKPKFLPKKRTNGFDFTTIYDTSGELFSFVFWKKFKTPKRRFKIN